MKLTKRIIDGLEYKGENNSQHIEWDDGVPFPFGVRLYPSGLKSFVLRYRNEHGRLRYMTLGKFGELTLQQARNLAADKLGEVRHGEDPAATRSASREATTVAHLCDEYLEKHAKVHKKTWKKDASRIDRHIKPAWKTRKAVSITHGDVAELHRTIGQENGTYEANRTLGTLSVMFNFARDEGIIPRGTPNPASTVKKYKEKKRERWVTPEEMAALGPAIDADENPYLRAAFWLLLLTGARKSEILNLTWANVDFDRKEIHFPDTKADRPHTVPLSTYAIAILRGLEREAGNPYVIAGAVDGQAFVNAWKPWSRACERANAKYDELEKKRTGKEPAEECTRFNDLRIHDLRRTAASWLAQSGYSEFVIKQLLNHSVKGVTGVYARMRPGAIRKAVEELGRQLMVAAGKAKEGEVVELEAYR